MALRGSGALTKAKREKLAALCPESYPWEASGLDRAERVIAFCEFLPITQGKLAGTQLVLREWQKDFIRAVYAEDDEGERPIRTAVLSVGRKNGKTQLAAALALCHLAGPESEARGEVYCAANDKTQAGKLYLEMRAIVRACPWLECRVNTTDFRKQMEVLDGDGDGSIFAALSSDAATKHGLSPSFVVYDELGQTKGRDLYEALDTAMGARDNPLMVVISTQAADDLAPMSELIDYGQRVNSGEITDTSFHCTLYAAAADAQIMDREAWAAANPALGDFRSLSDVKRQAEQATRMPAKEHGFRNLILNQRVSAHVRFLTKSEWDANGGEVDLEAMKGRTCFAGLDLSAARDLTAFVMVFPDDAGGFDVVPQFFLPEIGLRDRAEADRVPYDVWARQKHLTAIPGAVVDPSYVCQAIADAASRYDLRLMAYDRWRINLLKLEFEKMGVEIPMAEHGQGFRDMSVAVDKLERLVVEGKLRHGDNPILSMCAANSIITSDPAGNRKLDKARSNGRIDGLVALAMALAVADKDEGPAPIPRLAYIS